MLGAPGAAPAARPRGVGGHRAPPQGGTPVLRGTVPRWGLRDPGTWLNFEAQTSLLAAKPTGVFGAQAPGRAGARRASLPVRAGAEGLCGRGPFPSAPVPPELQKRSLGGPDPAGLSHPPLSLRHRARPRRLTPGRARAGGPRSPKLWAPVAQRLTGPPAPRTHRDPLPCPSGGSGNSDLWTGLCGAWCLGRA